MPEYAHQLDIGRLVLPDAAMPLAGWYAHPVGDAAARALHAEARQTAQRSLVCGMSGQTLAPRLAELIAGFWLGRGVALEHASLIATHAPEAVALIELVYGQLLISRKLAGAFEHLDRGFTLAVPRLLPADYFTLLRRHDLLRALSLGPVPAAPQTLPELLTEARVIRRLQPAGRRSTTTRHDDTLG